MTSSSILKNIKMRNYKAIYKGDIESLSFGEVSKPPLFSLQEIDGELKFVMDEDSTYWYSLECVIKDDDWYVYDADFRCSNAINLGNDKVLVFSVDTHKICLDEADYLSKYIDNIMPNKCLFIPKGIELSNELISFLIDKLNKMKNKDKGEAKE